MILTVDELRDHVTSGLEDDALQRLLDASEAAIIERAGATGAREELFGGGRTFLTLGRPATAIGTITEQVGTTVTTLATDDYLLHPNGYTLERLRTGTNGRWRWNGRVTVDYTPVDTDDLRALVQIELCQSVLNYNPGLAGFTIGTYSEQFANNSAWNNAEEWNSILSKLDVSLGMVVIG